MAYLGNTLINGSLRCLNKAYFNDLSIGNDVEIAGKTTTNQLVISSDYNPSNLASANSSTTAIPLVIGNPTGVHIAMDADEIQFKNNATSNRAGYINYGGGRIYLSNGTKIYADNGVFKADSLGTSDSRIPTAYITTLDATTGNITTLNASTGTVQDLEVKNVLKSFKWDISNVANLANDFMIAPTIEIATDGKVTVSKSGSDYIFTFADSNTITSDEFAGCKWLDGSKVRFTTKINDKLFSDVYGTVTGNMNTTSGRLAVKTSLTDDDLTGISMNTPYDAVGSTIMLYAITKTGDTNIYPVGIHMTAYGTNNSYYIDMYGGNSPSSSGTPAQPVFRIGNLGGITYNEQTLPAQWGVYTYNGYFEGAVVANEGKIGEWIIDSKKIYTGTWGSNNSAMMSPGTTSTDGNKSIGGSSSISGWTFTSGANFGVNKDGSLYANKGKIGDWVIETDRLHIGNLGDTTSVVLSTGITSTTDIGGSGTRTSQNALTWVFTAGNKFGVTNNGVLYASDVNVTGAVNASTLHVGSSSSTNHLIYENSTIDLQTDWLRFDSSTSTVIIGKDNAPRVNIDGQSMSLKDKDDNVYFKIGDMRVNGMYVFTTSKPDIVVTEVDHDHTPSYYADASCDIDENYDVKVFDEDDVELEYSSISHVELYGKTIGRVWLTKTSLVTNRIIKLAYTTTSGIYNFRYGDRSTSRSDGVFSVCFSKDGETNGSYAFAVGKFTEASGVASFSSGLHSKSTGEYSHAEGYYTEALNSCSHAEGFRTVAEGGYSHAEGCDSVAHGFANHAEGYECHAYNGGAGHAEGWGTKSYSNGSHSEGWYTVAVGAYSHAEGYYTRADGYGSHTSGTYTKATRDYQTVIGKYNANHSTNTIFDSGDYAFIIGNGTDNNNRSNALTVDWTGSVATGNDVTASGESSIATGCETVASGFYSHAEGLYSVASNTCSHASGEGTYATAANQTTIGKYNAVTIDSTFDPPLYDAGNYAFIIGNGTADNTRSNALTVDWDGSIRTNGCHINKRTDTTMGTHPSSDYYYACFRMRDSTDSDYARILHTHFTDGKAGFTIEALRQVNNSSVYNSLRLLVDDSGTRTVQVSDTAAWRNGLGMGSYLATYVNANNNNNQTYSGVICAGFLTNGSKQLMFHFPLNIIGGSITIKSLSVAVRGGSDQEYLYEASGSGTTYTQLGTNPAVVWENGATKRTNGVVSVYGYLRARSGISITVNFKNQLRKSASTTVAQNNMPVGVLANITFTVS